MNVLFNLKVGYYTIKKSYAIIYCRYDFENICTRILIKSIVILFHKNLLFISSAIEAALRLMLSMTLVFLFIEPSILKVLTSS